MMERRDDDFGQDIPIPDDDSDCRQSFMANLDRKSFDRREEIQVRKSKAKGDEDRPKIEFYNNNEDNEARMSVIKASSLSLMRQNGHQQ